MEPPESELYYEGILKALEQYQKGELELRALESIPKEDLLSAMRFECQRISRVLSEKNHSLTFNFLKNSDNDTQN